MAEINTVYAYILNHINLVTFSQRHYNMCKEEKYVRLIGFLLLLSLLLNVKQMFPNVSFDVNVSPIHTQTHIVGVCGQDHINLSVTNPVCSCGFWHKCFITILCA